ncbi:MAG: diphthine--ammonia ligase [Flavobacteriales bacterium]|nr:diphthine--ammonia ligase [Flavobacteriales bacterium]
MNSCFLSWSGGKDASMALYHLRKSLQVDVKCLLTTVSGKYQRVSMHGVRRYLLESQAASLELPLNVIELDEDVSMNSYEVSMKNAVEKMKLEGISTAAFGDIFLEDLKVYREKRLNEVGMSALFPLWKRNTFELAQEFVKLGFKAIVVCVNGDKLDRSFAGRAYDESFVNDLPEGVDPCGENGEFHTFVYDGPVYSRPVRFEIGETVGRTYARPAPASDDDKEVVFWFADLLDP